jgi:hypothetical protein
MGHQEVIWTSVTKPPHRAVAAFVEDHRADGHRAQRLGEDARVGERQPDQAVMAPAHLRCDLGLDGVLR